MLYYVISNERERVRNLGKRAKRDLSHPLEMTIKIRALFSVILAKAGIQG